MDCLIHFFFCGGGSPRSSYNPRVKEKQQTKRSVYITMQSRIVIMKLACFVFFACLCFVAWFDASSLWLPHTLLLCHSGVAPLFRLPFPSSRRSIQVQGSRVAEKWMVGR